MPTYDYVCPDCGPFEARAPIAEYRDPRPCPHCAAESVRALLTVPHFATMDAGRRQAHATNERSSHEPKSTKKGGHGPGCSCCASGAAKTQGSGAFYRPDGSKSFPAKRPWMISH